MIHHDMSYYMIIDIMDIISIIQFYAIIPPFYATIIQDHIMSIDPIGYWSLSTQPDIDFHQATRTPGELRAAGRLPMRCQPETV